MSDFKKDSYLLGKKGEELAANFIKSKGYFVSAKNYKSAHGEIDIIAENEKFVVFIEVKLRNEDSGYLPRETVTATKKHRLIYTARNYILRSHTNLIPRFDILEVIISNDDNIIKSEINHIENAFEVSSRDFY